MIFLAAASFGFSQKFFIGGHGGFFTSSGEVYNFSQDFYLWQEQGSFETSLELDPGVIFGASMGIFFTPEVGVRVDVDFGSLDAPAYATVDSPSPFYYNDNHIASAEFEGISYDLTAIHGDLIYRPRMGKNFFFFVGAGVSIWTGDLYVVDEIYWQFIDENTMVITEADFYAHSKTFIGFNAFAGIELGIGEGITFELAGRYSTASGEVEIDISNNPVEITLGGISATAGINLWI